MSAIPLVSKPPSHYYVPKNILAWFVGNYETDRVLAQLWESEADGENPVWIALPEYKNPNT